MCREKEGILSKLYTDLRRPWFIAFFLIPNPGAGLDFFVVEIKKMIANG
ncbi:hypothetical protein [Pseudoramibacter porci]|nr:hypothetical protein [Pseudoramibacter porci]